ncbi:MAG: DNA-binding protein [Halobacteriaceae archaeon]
MSDSEDDRLEELREERLDELQEQQEEGAQEAAKAQQDAADAQKKAMLRKHLTDGARQRLTSVRMSKPQVADQVEQQVLAVAQSGRLDGKIDEDQMKELLRELTPDSKSFDIKRR